MIAMLYFETFIFAFIVTVVITPIVRKLAIKINILDYPTNRRKIHSRPIPLLGGLAIFLSFSALTLVYWYLGHLNDVKINNLFIISILGGGALLMIGGYLDDKFSLKPYQQFIFPLLATLTVLFGGITINFVTNPLGGIIKIPFVIGGLIAFVWIIGMIYTTKFLDGLDGLATGITLIGSLIIFIVSLFWDVRSSGTSLLTLILAGSCLGFLIFNFYPAKIFLGEGGSVFLGFILAVLSIISGSKIATALLVMGIPIMDAAWVIIQRKKQQRSIFSGDKNHLHFKFLEKGFSQPQTVLILYFITVVFGLSSLLLGTKGKILAMIIMVIVIYSLTRYLIIKK